jgi:hypothetical protein
MKYFLTSEGIPSLFTSIFIKDQTLHFKLYSLNLFESFHILRLTAKSYDVSFVASHSVNVELKSLIIIQKL